MEAGRERDACRARVLAAALVVETAVGLTFFFPLYAGTLRRAYGLSNGSVQLLASIQNVGGCVGTHIGVFFDAFGPRLTVLLGLVIGGLAWGGHWLCLSYNLPAPFFVLACLSFLQGHGQLVADCASTPTVALHFPAEQYALALGLVKSLSGLSGSLAAQAYAALYAPPSDASADHGTIDAKTTSFLGLLSLWWAAACLVGAAGLRRDGPSADPGHTAPPQGHAERSRLDGWLGGTYGHMLLLVLVLACGAVVNEHLVGTAALRALHIEELTFGLAALALAAFIGHVLRGPAPAGADARARLLPVGGGCGGGWCAKGPVALWPLGRQLSRGSAALAAALLDLRQHGGLLLGPPALPHRAASELSDGGSDTAEASAAEARLAGILASEIEMPPPVPTSYSGVRPVRSTADLFDPSYALSDPADHPDSAHPSHRWADRPGRLTLHAPDNARGGHAPLSLASRRASEGAAGRAWGGADAGAPAVAPPPIEAPATPAPSPLRRLGSPRPTLGSPRGTAQALPFVGPNMSLREAVLSANFWLQFCVEFALAGSGLVITNNLAQIVRAMGPAASSAEAAGARPAGVSAASLVSILSVCNCTGRLAVALVVESLARRGMPRSLPFVPVCLLMALAHLLVAGHRRALLVPACALCGFAFGALAALNPVVLSTLYGSRSFGAIYTTIMLAAAAGSLLLSSVLAVVIYARATADGEPVCVGAGCFRATALTCAALCTLGSVLAGLLSTREAQSARRRRQHQLDAVAAALHGGHPHGAQRH